MHSYLGISIRRSSYTGIIQIRLLPGQFFYYHEKEPRSDYRKRHIKIGFCWLLFKVHLVVAYGKTRDGLKDKS